MENDDEPPKPIHLPRRGRSRRSSPSVTPEMAARIKRLIEETDLSQHDIAAEFGINQGRISEIMNGHAFASVPPA